MKMPQKIVSKAKESPHYSEGQTFGRPIEWTSERIEEEYEAFLEWYKKPDNIFYAKFAHERGYSDDTLREIASKHPDFSRTYAYAKRIQETKIVHGAMVGKYNAGFAQFYLKCNCGWKEPKEEVTETVTKVIIEEIPRVDGKDSKT